MSGFIGFDEVGGMRGLARDLNMRYIDEFDRQFWIDNPNGLPDLPLFKHGETQQITEIAYGAFAGLECKLFNFHALTYPDDPGNASRSCFLFGIRANFATLTIGPHTRLSQAQERSPDPFAKRFRVLGRDPEVAALTLDEPMQRWLLAMDDRLRIEISGNSLLGHTSIVHVDDLPLLLQQVFGVYLRIPDKAWDRYGWGGDDDFTPYQTGDPLAQGRF